MSVEHGEQYVRDLCEKNLELADVHDQVKSKKRLLWDLEHRYGFGDALSMIWNWKAFLAFVALVVGGVVMITTKDEMDPKTRMQSVLICLIPAAIILLIFIVRLALELKYARSKNEPLKGLDQGTLEKEVQTLERKLGTMSYYSGRSISVVKREILSDPNCMQQLGEDFCKLLYVIPAKDTLGDRKFVLSNWLAEDILQQRMAGLFDDKQTEASYTVMNDLLLHRPEWILRLLGVTLLCGNAEVGLTISPKENLKNEARELWNKIEDQMPEDYIEFDLVARAKDVCKILAYPLAERVKEEYLKRKS